MCLHLLCFKSPDLGNVLKFTGLLTWNTSAHVVNPKRMCLIKMCQILFLFHCTNVIVVVIFFNMLCIPYLDFNDFRFANTVYTLFLHRIFLKRYERFLKNNNQTLKHTKHLRMYINNKCSYLQRIGECGIYY